MKKIQTFIGLFLVPYMLCSCESLRYASQGESQKGRTISSEDGVVTGKEGKPKHLRFWPGNRDRSVVVTTGKMGQPSHDINVFPGFGVAITAGLCENVRVFHAEAVEDFNRAKQRMTQIYNLFGRGRSIEKSPTPEQKTHAPYFGDQEEQDNIAFNYLLNHNLIKFSNRLITGCKSNNL